MNKEDWLTKEQSSLEIERRKLKHYTGSDSMIMSKFLILLIPLFCIGIYFGSINGISSLDASEEVKWKCKACGYQNSSSKKDWTGHYVCSHCDERK